MPRFRHVLWLLLFAAVASGCLTPGSAYGQRSTAERSATLAVDGASELSVTAGAGDLVIEARESATEVQIKGTARARRESDLDGIQIRTDRDGDRLVVVTEIPNGNNQLDLTIVLPKGLTLEVDDGSGDAEIRGISGAFLEVNDGSGNLDIRNIEADTEVDDGSGNLELRSITGTVEVEDGSGDVFIAAVTGTVTIEEDGSGNITLTDVASDVRIEDDGSGDIDIRDVGGSVRIEEDGSGNITVSDVGGDFIVRDDGSGDIRYDNVAGRVDIPEDD